MAQYTVIQDIEAEDKLLGPLTLRQFVYAAIVVVMGFVAFQLGRAAWFLALPFVPPVIFFGLLAAPIGQNQSSEVWLLAKIRYFLFPRRRIWDQTGLQELVTITAPKQVERTYTKGFTEEEVTSRLKALANTLDTRGWVIKNVATGTAQPVMLGQQDNPDRLMDITTAPAQVEMAVRDSADVLNMEANPVAEDLSRQLDESSQEHRQELLTKVRRLADAQTQKSSDSSANPPPASSAIPVPANPMPPVTQPRTMNPSTVVAPEPKAATPATPYVPQPIINNAGDVVHMPETAKAALPPKEKATTAMTTAAGTAILDTVPDEQKTSIDVSHADTDTSDDNEVVISLR